MKQFSTILRIAFGIFIALFGAVMVVGYFAGDKTEKDPGIVFLVLVGIVPIIGGTLMARKGFMARGKMGKERVENQVLHLAKQNGGKLTPSELAMHSRLSLEEAQNTLNYMQEKGFAVLHTTERGAIVFEFHGLLSDNDRLGSKEV